MGLNCGIVGLPNVGKSTIFSALTSNTAEAANYPFCTIEPNVGIVEVPDIRLDKITGLINPKKVIPAIVEFVDIAGLVKGASEGQGLGNQFLGHIRQVGAIAHIVRCFDDPNIVHVNGQIDPLSDIETINTELALADLDVIERKLGNLDKILKSQDKDAVKKAKIARPVLERMVKEINNGVSLRHLDFDEDEFDSIKDLNLITLKKQMYICNVSEDFLTKDNEYIKVVKDYAEKEGASVLKICGQLEKEISSLESIEEKKEFMESVGLERSGLESLIAKGYEILNLKTFFTVGVKEVRAWTFKDGFKAPQTAGVIHSDFERGFIRAEVYHCDELISLGSEQKIKDSGKLRVEGKDYIVKDGDVMHFRFNV